MKDSLLLQYSRQIMLPEIDLAGQELLADSCVAIVGMGGLGCVASTYLATSGVGTLKIIDFDRIELSNLQRQILYSPEDIGKLKIDVAEKKLCAINPSISIDKLNMKICDAENLDWLTNVDLIIDASDNFETRFLINNLSLKICKPLVSGAAIRFEGQVSVFNEQEKSPCYECLYDNVGNNEETCATNGVIAPLLGIIGSVQALESIKILSKIGSSLNGTLLIINSKTMEWNKIKLNKDSKCPRCSNPSNFGTSFSNKLIEE